MSRVTAHRAILLVCIAALGVMAVAVIVQAHGELIYTLDDPYIHLALARNIAAGHYGINAGEYSAPSSSILWPVLLVPFVGLPFGEYAPLLINSLALLLTTSLLFRYFSLYASPGNALILSLAMAWSTNLLGLVFTGMEHSLQLLLVTVVATGLGGLILPRWQMLAALILLPWLRYEDFAISAPVLIWLMLRGERRAAAIALAMMLAGLIGFSLFLDHLGLGWLPSSVLAKQHVLTGDGLDRLARITTAVADNVHASWAVVLLGSLACLVPAVVRRNPARVLVIVVPAVLILMFGRNGWFGRYEAHLTMYLGLMAAGSILPPRSSKWLDGSGGAIEVMTKFMVMMSGAVLFIGATVQQWLPTLRTPGAATNIVEQQEQMAVIVRDHLQAPIAVNDLGLVAWRGGQPVLDLYGLGSISALHLRLNDPSGEWLAPFVAARAVDYVFIYSDWFAQVPSTWICVAELQLASPPIAIGGVVVSLFATTPEAAIRLRAALERYRASSPLGRRLLHFKEH